MKILEQFTTKTKGDVLEEIQESMGYLYATDAITAIRKKGTLQTPALNPANDATKFQLNAIFSEKTTEVVTIQSQDLQALFAPFKVEELMQHFRKDCKVCDATGTVKWTFFHNENDYSDYKDCPICQGFGYDMIKPSVVIGKKMLDTQGARIFQDISINPNFLDKIAALTDSFKLYRTNANCVLGAFDEYEFCIMIKRGSTDLDGGDVINIDTVADALPF